ncbi:sulfatase-like hydrolase/transferase [Haloferula sp.]|uniref:sulfatase-like hydrolase/transferase n=1 Tax=Haloferula sp. TaxID=2497595 RepID=UPI003C7873BF
MTKPFLTLVAWAASALLSQALVSVDFSHSYTGAAGANQNTGNITLAFTVDGSGNVTLDASCTDPDPAAYVDEFDGPVGTVSDPAMWSQSFSIVFSPGGSGNLRINNAGSGLAFQGGNPQIIDADTGGNNEVITATVTATGTQFALQGVNYAGLVGGIGMNVSGTNYALTGTSGTVDTSAQGINGTFTIATNSTSNNVGFVLSGFSFDLIPQAPLTPLVVDFTHSYTGPAGENPQNTGNITLAFTVDGSGNVTLDASCADADALPYVNEFDGVVGVLPDSALWGQSFTIVLAATDTGNLRIDNTGGGLAIQGNDPQRIDNDNEEITATVTTTGAQLNLQSVSFSNAALDPAMNVSGTSYPLANGSGTLDVSAQGSSGTFTIASTTNSNSKGFVLGGFEFFMTPSSGSQGFDNESGDNLWTTASNWNPNGLPVSPSDAIIDGYDVILSSALTSGPSALRILDGSLTIRDTGSLPLASMNIGEVLEADVRLVLEGSTASLSHTGSGVFTVGSSTTVETIPDNDGSSPLDLDNGELVLEIGYEWILDGRDYTGSYTLGDRFVLANFGTLSGPGFGSGNENGFSDTAGFRTRNFDLPANRKLQLVSTATSIYYEVVAKVAATGPNIIIVNVDDMAGGQHFNFEGRDCLTPTLDSLASNGLNFTSAFAASTVCGPSRYALMTGRWASRNTSAQFIARYPLGTLGRFGVADTELENDNQNLGAWLQQAGYRTGLVGKGHFTDDDLNNTGSWAAKGLMTYPAGADPRTDATTNAKMKHNHRVLCQRMQAFGFDYVSSYYKANLAELRNSKLNVHNQEWITKGALDFIEENKDERFFLYMAPTVNHGPVRNDLSFTLRADEGYTGAGYLPDEDYSFMPTRQSIINEVNGAGKEQISARETWIDYSVKAIVDKLTAHGIRDDTLIIFTSDHGEKDLNSTRPGQGPVIWGKSTLYDLGMRVPLVMNWPNGITSPGRVYDEIVSQVDLAPTLLALTGAAGLPTRPVDGVSLKPVFDSASAPAVRQDLLGEIGYARAVRTKDRKYIAVRYDPTIDGQIANSNYFWPRKEANYTPNPAELTEPRPYYVNNTQLGSLGAMSNYPQYYDDDQLFNMTADPTEDTNIYGQEPATAYDLKKRLANYLADFPNRPFRQFNNGSTEFSPAPVSAPAAPTSVSSQFVDLNTIRLDWSDTSNNELGYIIERSINGGAFEMVAELPSGTTSTDVAPVDRSKYKPDNSHLDTFNYPANYTPANTYFLPDLNIALDPNEEDIVLRVSAYNALGTSPAANEVDLLTPDAWRFRSFGDVDPELDDPISQWDFDADGDGQANLWEYAFATNPRLASSVARCEGKTTVVGENTFLEYLVPRDARRMVQISGSVSENLSSGWTGEPACVVVEDEPSHLLFRATAPVEDKTRQFIRAEIEEP